MISRQDHLSTGIAGIPAVQTATGVVMALTRSLAVPLYALGRWGIGPRFLGPAGLWMAVAVLIAMSVVFMVLTLVMSLVLNPMAMLSGAFVRSPATFNAFSRLVILVLIAQLYLAHRRERAGERIHSRSSGYPWLAFTLSLFLVGEWKTRLFVEPVMWLLIGWFISANVDSILGLYLYLSACSLAIQNFAEYASILESERDFRDAEIMRDIYTQIAHGRLRPGGIYNGVATPNVARAFYSEYVHQREQNEPRYAPGDDPALTPLAIEVAAEAFEEDAERAWREDVGRFLHEGEDAADGNGTAH